MANPSIPKVQSSNLRCARWSTDCKPSFETPLCSSKSAMSMGSGSQLSPRRHLRFTVLLSDASDLCKEALTGNADPANGGLIGKCPEFSKDDTKNAVKIAEEAFASFKQTTGRERARMLHKWYQLMMENLDDLALLITWENGKPTADAKGEVTYAASFFEWFSEEAPRTYGDTIPASIPGNRIYTLKQPIGVCGLITP